MATYTELYNLKSDSSLRNRVAVAITIKSKDIIALETPTQDQKNWATKAITNPAEQADKIYNYLLADNASATVSQIQSATDAAIQTKVNTIIDKLIAEL